jgi:hypothetical protein
MTRFQPPVGFLLLSGRRVRLEYACRRLLAVIWREMLALKVWPTIGGQTFSANRAARDGAS